MSKTKKLTSLSAMKGKLTMDSMLSRTLREFTTGPLNQLIVNLGGQDGSQWEEELKRFLRKEPCWVATVLQRLIATGKYDWINPGITQKNFPVPENFVLGEDPKVFHFNRGISSEDVIKEMDKEGYSLAMIWDLLDYGAKNPEEQRKYPIVGLGSVGEVDGDRDVPFLGRHDSERGLDLTWWDFDWLARCRFLGVRKKVSQASAS